MSKAVPSTVPFSYSVAKEQRTLTSSSHAPSPSSHLQMSWSSPTSTRPSFLGSLSSTRSLCNRWSLTAYEKEGETSLKNFPAHCHLLKATANIPSDHNLIKALCNPLCITFILSITLGHAFFVLYNVYASID